MSIKESKSLLFNDVSWRASLLGEQVILLECSKKNSIEKIHHSTHLIEKVLKGSLNDIVPAYHSIAVFTDLPLNKVIQSLSGQVMEVDQEKSIKKIVELPICYELGLDLSRLSKQSGLTSDEVIQTHLKNTYRAVFIGFTPGFIYADGLPEKLACPRLENPRQKIPAGSVGIAGNQTGIYSLSSPGGWNIIGRTPLKIFDPEREPIMKIDVSNRYRFCRITEKEFESWEK